MSENKILDTMWDDNPIDITQEANFIWSIANKLRGSYMPDKYGDVVIPMTILRRFECALQATKQAVLKAYQSNPNYPPKALCKIAGFSFYNTSEYDLKELCNDSKHIAANFKNYISGFSANVKDIFAELEMDKHIDKMEKDGCLYSVVEAFSVLDLSIKTYDSMESFIIDYQKRKGKSPSFREVMKALNMSSLNLVRTYILALENSGRIERTRLGNIDMLPKLKPSGVAITPIVGSIACGQPVDAVEQIEESVTLPRAIFGGGDLFILHTHGDSMIDIGIKHGDLVVIRKQNTAENGDIIVAMMNGETTLKRFYKRNGKVVLHPENKEMKDIIVKDCEIQGVLVSCIHIYN